MNRRNFITNAAMMGAGMPVITSAALTGCNTGEKKQKLLTPEDVGMFSFADKAPDGKPIRAALIGCGSRGTGAAEQFIRSGAGCSIVAMADLFPDRMNASRKHLKEKLGNDVPESACFLGFDAYKKALEIPDIDAVLLCTPQHFRPEHFMAAVNAGKHAFVEKPCAVDPVGVRTVLAAGKIAKSKGLTVVAGTHLRHRRDYWEAYLQVRNGLIGDVICASAHSNQGAVWYKTQQPGWSDMEYCIRNFFNIRWVSGDHFVDQAIHFIDIATWFMDERPERAVGYGGRARCKSGDRFDFFTVDYYYANNRRMWTEARQIDGCDNNFSDQIYGSKGVVYMNYMHNDLKITDYNGNPLWEYAYAEKPIKSAYQQEHIHFTESIRTGKQINQAEMLANSTLIAIMGREAAYTGKAVTWNEIAASNLRLGPTTYEMGALPDYHEGVVPVPGIAQG